MTTQTANLAPDTLYSPRFDKAVKLYESPDAWIIHSFSIVDLNQDGKPNVVVNVLRGSTRETESQLWSLETQGSN